MNWQQLISTPTDARAAQVSAIRDAAIVRSRLGQGAGYMLLSDGRHEVVFRGRSYQGRTLEETIDAAERREGQHDDHD